MVINGVFLTPIPSEVGYSNYLVDTVNGKIYNTQSEKFLVANPNDNGYVYVGLKNDEGIWVTHGVHRLVMASVTSINLEKFKRGGYEVDHYPNELEKWNNRMDNLQLSDRKSLYRKETIARMGDRRPRLNKDDVREILSQFKEWEGKTSDFIWKICNKHQRSYRSTWYVVNGKVHKDIYSEIFG